MRSLLPFACFLLAAILLAAISCLAASPQGCIQAAEDVGLPSHMVDQLRDPDGLNPIEKAALQQALRRTGIDDVCANRAGAETSLPTPTPARHPSAPSVFNRVHDSANTIRDLDENQENVVLLQASSARETHDSDPQWGREVSYNVCLDEVFLRTDHDFDYDHAHAAAVWYCRHLEPQPTAVSNPDRCKLTNRAQIESAYPEWGTPLVEWAAIAACSTERSANLPPSYTRCLDTAYLQHGNENAAAWLCRDLVPQPPEVHRQRCDLNTLDATKRRYSEWPDDLHDWHAVMQCLPEWQPLSELGWDAYDLCTSDIYLKVAEQYDKDVAIPAAVWRCRNHQPNAPGIYTRRCVLDHIKDESADLPIPNELRQWRAIIRCFPPYQT